MRPPKFALRILFEKLLGKELMAYLLHLRPLEWPIMTAHLLLGTMWAVGFQAFGSPSWRWTLLGWFVFVVLLNGGTLAINSAFDKDEGDIGYLKAPPKPPKYLLHVSILLLAASLLLSLTFLKVAPKGKYFFEIVMTCVLMSVLYSVPPIRLKARAGWDLIINCVGFGFFTPMAGWAITGKPLSAAVVDACVGFGFLFASLYPMTQIYQVAEDTARGDQTLVIRMGVARSLSYAIGAAIVAHLWFLQAVLKDHRAPIEMFVFVANGECISTTFPKGGPSPAFLAISLLAWLAVLIPWRARWKSWSDAQHEAAMYRGLLAWGITDVSLLILMWPK